MSQEDTPAVSEEVILAAEEELIKVCFGIVPSRFREAERVSLSDLGSLYQYSHARGKERIYEAVFLPATLQGQDPGLGIVVDSMPGFNFPFWYRTGSRGGESWGYALEISVPLVGGEWEVFVYESGEEEKSKVMSLQTRFSSSKKPSLTQVRRDGPKVHGSEAEKHGLPLSFTIANLEEVAGPGGLLKMIASSEFQTARAIVRSEISWWQLLEEVS